jgi:tetratricopeptide (TPR) repeat protein
VLQLAEQDQRALFADVGWLLFLWARALIWQADATSDASRRPELLRLAEQQSVRAEQSFGAAAAPRAVWLQRALLHERAGRRDEARKLRDQAGALAPETPLERLLTLSDNLGSAPREQTLAFLQEISRSDPQNFANWLRLGNLFVALAKLSNQPSYCDEAEHCYSVGIALRPDVYWAYVNRGLLCLEQKQFARARDDFDRVITLRPHMAMAYVNRALARMGTGDCAGATDDLTRALECNDAPTQALFLRARARRALNDAVGAEADVAEGLKRTPGDPVSWVTRGMARLPADPQGALADFDAALALSPRYDRALENKANVLAERLGRTDDAITVLDAAVAHHPGYVKALAGRGVLLARRGRRDDAVRDARAALALDDGALTAYQAACVFALTSHEHPADRAEALRLLAQAVRKDGSWLAVSRQDPDLNRIRDQPRFRALVQSLEVVVGAGDAR